MTDTEPTPVGPEAASGSSSPREDAATKSAREELKHTVISEKHRGQEDQKGQKDQDPKDPKEQKDQEDKEDQEDQEDEEDQDDNKRRATTPDSHDALKEQVSSPKKKRAHDELDDGDENEAGSRTKAQGGASADTSHAPAALLDAPNGGSTRAEPEKKRLRDELGDGSSKDAKASPNAASAKDPDVSSGSVPKAGNPKTAASTSFASSGFAKLTSSASPFGALGGTGSAASPSLFGAAAAGGPSPFGALGRTATALATKPASTASPAATLTSPPMLSFGGGAAASPFASLQGAGPSTTVFGSAFGGSARPSSGIASLGGGFGSGFGAGGVGAKSAFGRGPPSLGLAGFSGPGDAFKSSKPAKPFGAPESDNEDSGEEESAAAEDENGDEGEGGEDGREPEEKSKLGAEEKKKQRLQRVAVDDGEAGEATILQVRARMYYLDKDLGGWKERGAGMLKVNVPEQCVEFDRDGSVIPASFDASMLGDEGAGEGDEAASEDADGKSEGDTPKAGPPGTGAAGVPKRTVVRLIMRQDSTHRVILNTAVLASTEFKERQTLKATTVLFTAFEGADAKPVSVQAKMNIANAKTFLSAMDGIQKELRGE